MKERRVGRNSRVEIFKFNAFSGQEILHYEAITIDACSNDSNRGIAPFV